MALFLSTYVNKVDRKGRVSVPAPFRAAVAEQSFPGIVVFRSNNNKMLEGSGIDRLEEMVRRLELLPEYSPEREALESVFPDAQPLAFDSDGRILLPPEFCEHANIILEGNAAFVGNGRTFQIWEPARFEHYQEERRARARGLTLPPLPGAAK